MSSCFILTVSDLGDSIWVNLEMTRIVMIITFQSPAQDRTNLAFAAASLNEDLGFSEYVYGLVRIDASVSSNTVGFGTIAYPYGLVATLNFFTFEQCFQFYGGDHRP